jgi:alpha-tubulin suppressor-like RCC1 family protein
LNPHGELGDGQRVNKLSPTPAVEVGPLARIVASGESCVGLTKQGDVEAWGYDRRDALGAGEHRGQFSLTPLLVGIGAVEISATATDGEYRT